MWELNEMIYMQLLARLPELRKALGKCYYHIAVCYYKPHPDDWLSFDVGHLLILFQKSSAMGQEFPLWTLNFSSKHPLPMVYGLWSKVDVAPTYFSHVVYDLGTSYDLAQLVFLTTRSVILD